MKKMMGLIMGLTTFVLIVGCQKKEARAPIEEPIVTEETSATALANLEAASVNMSSDMSAATPSALEAVSNEVSQAAASVIENPTSQQIQEALKSAGYYEGKIDGTIGPKTKSAIEKFQTENGLNADGKVGPKTWAKLGVQLASGAVNAVSANAAVTEPILGADPAAMNSEVVSQ